jgi:hypothetical protein
LTQSHLLGRVLLDAPNALEWADFGLKVVTLLLGIAMQVVMILIVVMMARTFWGFYTEGRHGDFPTGAEHQDLHG